MCEYQQYYQSMCTSYWAHENPSTCGCGGKGWKLSEVDTWHQCPYHGKDIPHPEDYEDELQDTYNQLGEAEKELLNIKEDDK
jgi:hypothetical protein